METQILQYQLSNGNWIDCKDRNEEFLTRCATQSGLDRECTIRALSSGKTLRNDSDDWYSNCRFKPEPVKIVVAELVKCSCGHSVPKISVMNASLGTSCPDCYDRLSC